MKAIIAGFFLVAFFGAPAHAAGKKITGTKHDFQLGYFNGTSTYTYSYGACGACHSAHKAKDVPQIWARSAPTTTGWVVYDAQDPTAGKTLGADDGRFLSADAFVLTNSGRCLGCHDGVTAIGGTVTMAALKADGSANTKMFGRDLHGKHPVGVRVPWGTEGWFAALNTAYPNAPASDHAKVKEEALGTVGCTSCHSMHSSGNSSKILREGDRCLACHDR